MADNPIVFVIDDDEAIQKATRSLLRSVGLRVVTFGSAQEFLRYKRPDAPACLVLDMHLPGISGLDLQRELVRRGAGLPIVFITGRGDVPMTVQAMKAGAVEFLTKPFHYQQLLDAVQEALARDREGRRRQAERQELRRRYDALTPRQREVMAHVVAGRLNKQIAAKLGTSEIMVKVHRAHVMQKMRVDSVADLVRIAERLDPPRGRESPPDAASPRDATGMH